MNKKQKMTHLGAVKSAFFISALAAINQHLVGKNAILWSRLDNKTHSNKVQSTFDEAFAKNVESLMQEDYLSVAEQSGKSHDKFVEKASNHFSKIIQKHSGEFNQEVLLREITALDKFHQKHI